MVFGVSDLKDEEPTCRQVVCRRLNKSVKGCVVHFSCQGSTSVFTQDKTHIHVVSILSGSVEGPVNLTLPMHS